MNEMVSPMARIWDDTLRDAALAGLKAEMDGLAAMFSVLTASGLLPSRVGPGALPPEADDLDMDNLPI